MLKLKNIFKTINMNDNKDNKGNAKHVSDLLLSEKADAVGKMEQEILLRKIRSAFFLALVKSAESSEVLKELTDKVVDDVLVKLKKSAEDEIPKMFGAEDGGPLAQFLSNLLVPDLQKAMVDDVEKLRGPFKEEVLEFYVEEDE